LRRRRAKDLKVFQHNEYTKSRSKRNAFRRTKQISELVAELSAAPLPTTDAGKFLCRRHMIHPQIADLLAQLAGLGLEEARQS
jgi:hypothetical protein